MDTFRTTIQLKPFPGKGITYLDRLFFLGSCFTSHIGSRMASLHFRVCLNPFGILFNPASITGCLERTHSGIPYSEEDLRLHNGLWYSLDHHSSFSQPDRTACLHQINLQLVGAHEALAASDVLLLTFGSAWAYRHRETGRIAANCHKLPEAEFDRFLLQPGFIAENCQKILDLLRKDNPALRVIFTVSPVRHLRDGMEGNQLSKSTLLLAIQQLLSSSEYCAYFPAYEIMMDDLRDYRFYEPDMVHPNSTAIDYIWNKFSELYFDRETREIEAEVERLNQALRHRPLHPGGTAYLQFCEAQLRQISLLQEKYPFLALEEEEKHFLKALDRHA